MAKATSISPLSRARDRESDTEGGSRYYEIIEEVLGRRGIRIYQCTNTSRSGKKLTQQAQSLCHQFAHERVHAGGVAAGPIEARDEAGMDRIGAEVTGSSNFTWIVCSQLWQAHSIRRSRSDCCARAASGHAAATPPSNRHGERTKAAIAEKLKFSALLKILRAGLT
jgi:hypothetical protein